MHYKYDEMHLFVDPAVSLDNFSILEVIDSSCLRHVASACISRDECDQQGT